MAEGVVSVKLETKGQSELDRLTSKIKALEKNVEVLNAKNATLTKGLGPVAKGATAFANSLKAVGAAATTALGPLAPLLATVAGLSAAFQTLSGQDFSNAKVESLGVNAEVLNKELQIVTKELQGSASVAELTAAAYDVASAGFTNAADAAKVLKAASQAATGGFSDINTVGNAATSVLNAYGKSASDAQALVDGFIQTQNDGKIVVEEYAQNIGKVASAAAGLQVPIEEVNAVIAQSTAAGVQAEVAFTGLKGALARLASGEASKALKDFGIEINSSTIASDGLLGTLKKLEGLDTGTLFKALGTESGPALLPVLQNLERFEELLENQKDAAGTAAEAQAKASNTIQGAWKRLTVAFQNLFSDQSELGEVLKGTLLAAAATVEALVTAFKALASVGRGVAEGIGRVVSAVTGIEDGSVVLQNFTDGWFALLQGVEDVAAFITEAIARLVNYAGQQVALALSFISDLVSQAQNLFGGLWDGISAELRPELCRYR